MSKDFDIDADDVQATIHAVMQTAVNGSEVQKRLVVACLKATRFAAGFDFSQATVGMVTGCDTWRVEVTLDPGLMAMVAQLARVRPVVQA